LRGSRAICGGESAPAKVFGAAADKEVHRLRTLRLSVTTQTPCGREIDVPVSRPSPGPRLRATFGWIAYASAAVLLVSAAYRMGEEHAGAPRDAGRAQMQAEQAATLPESSSSPDPVALAPESAPAPAPTVRSGVVQRGDTLSSLLRSHLSPAEVHRLAEAVQPVFPVSRIAAGRPYEIGEVAGSLESFRYEIDRETRLVISREEGLFQVSREPIPYSVETDVVNGTIRTSLFEAVSESGESLELALALAEIFAWDIDFLLDIRKGDSFQALVERRFREGEPAGYGRILAARFVNRGDVFHAVWFQDGDRPPGYYDLGGNSLRKAFLKAPLTFTRISSGFSKKRFHPITQTWKAHPAIDYAAPAGTPIKTVGDGVVTEKGFTSGNGNYVKIRHNSSYETLYLHMSRFAKGLAKGKRVSQGEVIGYVGSTGLATGPHLCFRMYRNGSPVNPMRIQTPSADPVSPDRMEEFESLASRLTSRFDPDHLEQASLSGSQGNALR
jgi:murein DD-endopeptidase MepM/ murein hydrolase activator NlpD